MKYILLVDDDIHQAASIGTSLAPILKALNFGLEIRTDPEDILIRFDLPFGDDLVGAIVDLWMVNKRTFYEDPQLGLKVIDVLRGKFPAVPIVILSAHLDENGGNLVSQFDNILTVRKPASAREVLEKLLGTEVIEKAFGI